MANDTNERAVGKKQTNKNLPCQVLKIPGVCSFVLPYEQINKGRITFNMIT